MNTKDKDLTPSSSMPVHLMTSSAVPLFLFIRPRHSDLKMPSMVRIVFQAKALVISIPGSEIRRSGLWSRMSQNWKMDMTELPQVREWEP